MLTQEKLKSILEYNPLTGEFIYKVTRGNKKKGSIAGTIASDGYIRIQISGKIYMAHLLAFLYMEGYLPEMVDHKDRVRSNNKWDNLRKSTSSQNQRNKKIVSKSGYSNIIWDRKNQKWRVILRDPTGTKKSIGSFNYLDLELAVDKANEIRELYNGEFAIKELFDGTIPSLEYLNS
ncbi:HNH endonuclease [Salmonella enterica]|nr:HNH endonuclease [Salmonella enterica]